jgi:hypothetical protein
MAETHQMLGEILGEPLAAGHVGARVRVPLTGVPTPRWTRVFGAHLMQDLVGHRNVGHLHLNDLVQGRDLVLEGVEEKEAAALGPCLRHAIDAANRACAGEPARQEPNMTPQEAQGIAHRVVAGRVED